MKTRIIKTRIWSEDEKFSDLSVEAKLLFLYFITNERIGMSGIYECPTKKTKFEIGLTDNQYECAVNELTENKRVFFRDGWVYVVNAEKHNNYRNGPTNEKAYQNEILSIPSHIKEYFDTTIDSTVDSSMYTNHKQETINNKQETINNKSKIRNNKSELKEWKKSKSFMEFYNQYPRKKSPTAAFKAWNKLSEEDKVTAKKSLVRHKYLKQWKKDKTFIPHPATWLNQRRWEDEIDRKELDIPRG